MIQGPLVICLHLVIGYLLALNLLSLPLSLEMDHLFLYIVLVRLNFPLPPLLLRDVLVAPALIKNLISVRQFTCDNLVSAEFDPFGLSVKDYLTKAEIARFNSSGDLYSLNGVPAATPPTSMLASVDLWHRRLGHPNPAVLASMLSEFTIHVIGTLIILCFASLVN